MSRRLHSQDEKRKGKAVVGVLVEVPVMLTLVAIANRTRHWFPAE